MDSSTIVQAAAGSVGRPPLGSTLNAEAVQPKDYERLWMSQPTSILADLACYSVILLGLVFWKPLAMEPHGWTNALTPRISLVNLLTAIVSVALWSIILALTSSTRPIKGLIAITCYLLVQICLCTGVVGLFLLPRHPNMANVEYLSVFACGSLFLTSLCRAVLLLYRTKIRPMFRPKRIALIVGSGWRGQLLAQRMNRHPRWNYNFFGFVDSSPPGPSDHLIGGIDRLEHLLMCNPIDEVIITLPVKSKYDDIQEAISICERLGIQSCYSTDLFSTQVTKRRSVDQHNPSAVLLHMIHNDSGRSLKRFIDVLLAATTLFLLSPVMLLIAIGIRVTSLGPIVFRQERYGLNRRLFTMYKFRSMVIDAEAQQERLEHLNETTGPVFKIRRDPRITTVGRLIRNTSLDELPQLWNVLRGEMSIVGPRPLPMRDVSRFTEAWLMRRFSVPPGITGLWQVSGRSNVSFAEWMQLDLNYIDHWSLLLDFRILAKTIPAVLRKEGAV